MFPTKTLMVLIKGVDFVPNAILVWPRERNLLVLVNIGVPF